MTKIQQELGVKLTKSHKLGSDHFANFTLVLCREETDEEPSAASTLSCSSYVLARFLAAAGHIALQQVIHVEVSVLGEIKRRERLKEDSKGVKKKIVSATPSVNLTHGTKVMYIL